MTYLHVKALHIIFVVSWFAGLFYLPRLFVYHTEAQPLPDRERKVLFAQFTKFEKLLWNAIMTPAMWLTLLTGATMLYITPDWLNQGWMQLKLAFVLGLLGYHFYSRKLLLEIRQEQFRFSSLQLRLWNEVATVFLFSIVFLVVLKNTLDWIWGVVGLIAFAVLIMSAVRIAKKIREKKQGQVP
ncbi:CopD family protein [Telluribacter sp.]|jgi:putative membrane protein|uniref:CopD family protein n=1 Tax=Telluribacter sp. TaxID=1978767 RepID=UPI002E10E964|nr:CopD family protein [Telluribacter sp.]